MKGKWGVNAKRNLEFLFEIVEIDSGDGCPAL